jgi:hypothetical protein
MNNTLDNSPNIMVATQRTVRVPPVEEVGVSLADSRLASNPTNYMRRTIALSMTIFQLSERT